MQKTFPFATSCCLLSWHDYMIRKIWTFCHICLSLSVCLVKLWYQQDRINNVKTVCYVVGIDTHSVCAWCSCGRIVTPDGKKKQGNSRLCKGPIPCRPTFKEPSLSWQHWSSLKSWWSRLSWGQLETHRWWIWWRSMSPLLGPVPACSKWVVERALLCYLFLRQPPRSKTQEVYLPSLPNLLLCLTRISFMGLPCLLL